MKIKTKLSLQLILITVTLLCISAAMGRIEFLPDHMPAFTNILAGLSCLGFLFVRLFVNDRV